MASNNNNSVTVRSGARKKLQFRDTRLGVLPNTIDAFSRLTVDAAVKAALTSAGAKLTVEIDTAGTRVFLADQRTGQLIGGPEDLQRLGGIKSFVNRERKDAIGKEVVKEVTQLAYKASVEARLDNPEYVQIPLEASYGAAAKPLLSVVSRLGDNLKKLEGNTNPTSRNVFEPFLKNMFVKIRNAYFHMIIHLTKGENTKGRLQELIFERGVPEYVHARLTNASLVLDRGQELARVLFPSDPSKGLSLTMKEWRSKVFRDKLGKTVLGASHLVVKLANDSDFIRTITKIDSTISLDDETNPSVAKLLKCRLAVMPPMNESRYVTDPASKTKAGWKFPSPGMDSIQGAINALSTALMRIYSANLQSVDLLGDYYNTIVPGAISRAAVTPTNNYYAQWANANDPETVWIDHLYGGTSGEHRANVWRWLRVEMRLSEQADGGKTLAAALLLKEDGSLKELLEREVEVEKPDPKDATKKVVVKEKLKYYPQLPEPCTRDRAFSLSKDAVKLNLNRPLADVEVPLWKKFQEVTFPSPKRDGKTGRVAVGNTLTRLSKDGNSLCEEIDKISPLLAERMRVWLRGFSDVRIQGAAVKLANASFDELFINEQIDDDDESGSDESDNDE